MFVFFVISITIKKFTRVLWWHLLYVYCCLITEYSPITQVNNKAQLSLTNPRDAKACQNCSISTCLQRCRWQYWPIFFRLAVVASELCEIPRNSLKNQTYRVHGHPRSSILVSIESALCNFILVINSNFGRISYSFQDIDTSSYKIACFPHPTIGWHRLAEERLALSI